MHCPVQFVCTESYEESNEQRYEEEKTRCTSVEAYYPCPLLLPNPSTVGCPSLYNFTWTSISVGIAPLSVICGGLSRFQVSDPKRNIFHHSRRQGFLLHYSIFGLDPLLRIVCFTCSI